MKNKFLLLLIVFLGFIASCNNRPKEMLSDEKMKAIMTDLFLFDGAAYVKNISFNDTIKEMYYNQILYKHGVTMAAYDSTLVWYLKHSKDYAKLHDEVLVDLKQFEGAIEAGTYIRPIAPNDSLDSLTIKSIARDFFVLHDGKETTSKFPVNAASLESEDVLKVSFQVRLQGDIDDPKAIATILVQYADSTRDEKEIPLVVEIVPNQYSLSITIPKDKKVEAVSVDLFKHKNPLKLTQRVYINSVRVQRIFNPYRKK